MSRMAPQLVEVGRILTRTCGFLSGVTSHSLQPYRGCALGGSLCGVGCYVRHNWWVTRGRPWGTFVEVRTNAAAAYRAEYAAEQRWARRTAGRFGIFLSSSTEPFQPAETTFGITRAVLAEMVQRPPDVLIVQSHSHRMAGCLDFYRQLHGRCDLRLQLSIETDRDALPGLPRSASPVARRLEAAAALHAAGLRVIIAVAPLLPMDDPEAFFARLATVADEVIVDHYIDGDGSPNGCRTRRTALPQAMAAVNPLSVSLEYRREIAQIAERYFPGRVGINAWSPAPPLLELPRPAAST
jgi:DNA repair photolyase